MNEILARFAALAFVGHYRDQAKATSLYHDKNVFCSDIILKLSIACSFDSSVHDYVTVILEFVAACDKENK